MCGGINRGHITGIYRQGTDLQNIHTFKKLKQLIDKAMTHDLNVYRKLPGCWKVRSLDGMLETSDPDFKRLGHAFSRLQKIVPRSYAFRLHRSSGLWLREGSRSRSTFMFCFPCSLHFTPPEA